MKNRFAYGLLLICAILAGDLAVGEARQIPLKQNGTTQIKGETYGEQLGTVSFPVSCKESALRYAERGLALLHHMTYERAAEMNNVSSTGESREKKG